MQVPAFAEKPSGQTHLSSSPRKNQGSGEAQDRGQANRFRVGTLDAARSGLRVSTEGRGRFCAADWFAAVVASCSFNASSSLA